MFGKDKYVYTCPDSIHDHEVAKKRTRNTLIAYAVVYGGGFVALKIAEAREKKHTPDLTVVPDPVA